jgi:hypothetical protein
LTNELTARMAMEEGMAVFVGQLLNLAVRNKQSFARADQKYFDNTVLFVKRTASRESTSTVENLLSVIRTLQH